MCIEYATPKARVRDTAAEEAKAASDKALREKYPEGRTFPIIVTVEDAMDSDGDINIKIGDRTYYVRAANLEAAGGR
jgi:hypothetical protein